MTLNTVFVAKPQEFPGPICSDQQAEGEISLNFKCKCPKALKQGVGFFFFNVER